MLSTQINIMNSYIIDFRYRTVLKTVEEENFQKRFYSCSPLQCTRLLSMVGETEVKPPKPPYLRLHAGRHGRRVTCV